MKYWIMVGEERRGPMDLDELRCHPIDEDTPVWHPGLEDWVTIKDLPEAEEILGTDTMAEIPPIPTVECAEVTGSVAPSVATEQEFVIPEKPQTLLWVCILAIILCCTPAAIVALFYSVQTSSRYNMGDYEGAERASATMQNWLIASIVLGVLSTPITLIMNLI